MKWRSVKNCAARGSHSQCGGGGAGRGNMETSSRWHTAAIPSSTWCARHQLEAVHGDVTACGATAVAACITAPRPAPHCAALSSCGKSVRPWHAVDAPVTCNAKSQIPVPSRNRQCHAQPHRRRRVSAPNLELDARMLGPAVMPWYLFHPRHGGRRRRNHDRRRPGSGRAAAPLKPEGGECIKVSIKH